MKKKIILFLVVVLFILAILIVVAKVNNSASESVTSNKVTAEVIKLDGTQKKMPLKRQDINEFSLGDTVYSEYESGIFQEGKVVGLPGDSLSLKGNSIYNGNTEIYTSSQLGNLSESDLFGEENHVACHYSGEDSAGKVYNNAYDECIEFVTVDSDNNLSVTSSYIDRNGEYPIDEVFLYIEDN